MGRASLPLSLLAASIVLAATSARAAAPTGTVLLPITGSDETAELRARADAALHSALAVRLVDLVPAAGSELT